MYVHENYRVDSKSIVVQLFINNMKNDNEVHITYNK